MADDTRERILGGALELLRSAGPHAFSMDALAEWTGVSRKTIYNHFDGKGDLLAEVVATGMDRIVGGLRTIAADASLGFVEKLDRIVERGFRESKELWGAGSPGIGSDSGGSAGAARAAGAVRSVPNFRSTYQEVRALLAELIEGMAVEASAGGLLRPDVDPRRFAYMLVCLIGGVIRFEDPDALPCPRLELLRESIRICLTGALSPVGAETLRGSRILAREETPS